MSPTVEGQLLEMVRDLNTNVRDIQGDVAETKGRVIAIEATLKQRDELCNRTHRDVDRRIGDLENGLETTDVHDRDALLAEVNRYKDSTSHWWRYAVGIVGTLVTGGIGALITFALTHR